MKLKIEINNYGYCIQPLDAAFRRYDFYLEHTAVSELAKGFPKGKYKVWIDDGIRDIHCSTWGLTALRTSHLTDKNGITETTGLTIKMDVVKFCDTLRVLREKFWKKDSNKPTRFTLESESFCRPLELGEYPPIPSTFALARHPNAVDLVRNLRYFSKRLAPDSWVTFRRHLGQLLPVAKIYGSLRDLNEIYFDGRYVGGCGYNGVILLRDTDWSSHT